VLAFLDTLTPLAIVALLATGVLIGGLAGLLGIGGGIVAVPVLIAVLAMTGLAPERAVPVAIGSSQATILITGLGAALAHRRAGTIDGTLVRRWLPALLAGAAVGLVLARLVQPGTLTAIFAVVAAMLAVRMMTGDRAVLAPRWRDGFAGRGAAPGAIGLLAASVGVGAGTLSGPVLALLGTPLRAAVGAGAAFNVAVALPAAAIAAIAGEIAWFCVVMLSGPALIVAPWAARWSRSAPIALMRGVFALCLVVIAVRMAFAR